MTMMSATTTIRVGGMTCGHCTSAVTEELKGVRNVVDVDIDLVKGGQSPVTITHNGPIDLAKVREAVAEAGDYTVSV